MHTWKRERVGTMLPGRRPEFQEAGCLLASLLFMPHPCICNENTEDNAQMQRFYALHLDFPIRVCYTESQIGTLRVSGSAG